MANIDELLVDDLVQILNSEGAPIAIGIVTSLAPGADVAAVRVHGAMMDTYYNVSKLRLDSERKY